MKKGKLFYRVPRLHKTEENLALCVNGSAANSNPTTSSCSVGSNIGTNVTRYAICKNGPAAIGGSGHGTATCSDGTVVNELAGCTSGTNPVNPGNCFSGSSASCMVGSIVG